MAFGLLRSGLQRMTVGELAIRCTGLAYRACFGGLKLQFWGFRSQVDKFPAIFQGFCKPQGILMPRRLLQIFKYMTCSWPTYLPISWSISFLNCSFVV